MADNDASSAASHDAGGTETQQISILCPFCSGRPIDSAADVVSGRGLILTFRLLHRKILGCNHCVRAQLRQQAARSALVGWVSLPALFVNPFLVLYNLLRSFTVGANRRAVKKTFASVGVDASGSSDLVQVGYALAAAMITADGNVDAEELKVAEHLGPRLFEGFDAAKLEALVASPSELPSAPDQARLLRNLLSDEQKTSVFSFLFSIARADGQVDPEEKLLLKQIARYLGIDLERWQAQVRGVGT